MDLTNEDVITEVCRRMNLPDKQVRMITVDFWRCIKRMLQYPEDYFYQGIRIKNFCKISINPGKVLKDYLYLLDKGEPMKTANQMKIHLYNKILLYYGVYTQRQKQVQNFYERHQKRNICETGIWAKYIHGSKYASCPGHSDQCSDNKTE